jgi:hypothetical protein
MRREQDVYRAYARFLRTRGRLLDLPIQRSYSFFEHSAVCGDNRAAEVALHANAREFQPAALLFRNSDLRRYIGLARAGGPAQRFFLLGFHRL